MPRLKFRDGTLFRVTRDMPNVPLQKYQSGIILHFSRSTQDNGRPTARYWNASTNERGRLVVCEFDDVDLPVVLGCDQLEPICQHNSLRFRGHIAAPGYGQSWECAECDLPFWSPSGAINAVPRSKFDDPPELSIGDII